MLCSFQTDRPGGFAEAEVVLLRRLTPVLALTFRSIVGAETGEHADGDLPRRGCRAARAGGAIDRGVAETVRAVLWYSDLEGFTRIADEEPAAELLALLNDYAEVVVDSVHAHGGQVLKFIGDGILAMFPLADERHALRPGAWTRRRQRWPRPTASAPSARPSAGRPRACTWRCMWATCSTATSAAATGSTSPWSARPSTRSPGSRRCAARSTNR